MTGGRAEASTVHGDAERFADLPNLDTVKDRIREYFGDHLDGDGRHQWSTDSAWMREVTAVVESARHFLDRRLADAIDAPALVIDVDDTAVSTYPYLANTGFGNRQNREVLPAIPPVLQLATDAHDRGVALFFVTVRLPSRRADTIANLRHVGYPPPREVYLRPTAGPYPAYMPSPTCTHGEFKASVRRHIEEQGFRVLASLGDQDSDLRGGHAEAIFKLPNPLYHTP